MYRSRTSLCASRLRPFGNIGERDNEVNPIRENKNDFFQDDFVSGKSFVVDICFAGKQRNVRVKK